MADTFTANLNLDKIEVGASDDTWGDKVNANMDAIDAKFASSGPGTAIPRDAANEANLPGLKISGAAATFRSLRFYTATSLRWLFGANATAESGANAGSDLELQSYDDAGNVLGTLLRIIRSTGAWSIFGAVTFNIVPKVGTDLVYTQGNDGPGSGLDADLHDSLDSA